MLQGTMRIATWNVNSLRIRLPHVQAWLASHQPDVLLLQETKVEDAYFPKDVFSGLGYHFVCHGQKSYNGVAILSRHPLTGITYGLPDLSEPSQCRVMAATVEAPAGPLRVVSAYVPNGGSVESDKFIYKQEFYRRLTAWLADQVTPSAHLVVGGDFNIAADARDVDSVAARTGHVLFTEAEQQWLADFRRQTGLSDALRLLTQAPGVFSWWDYRAGAVEKNQGVRIDYLFVSPALAPKVAQVTHSRDERTRNQPSDHVPVMLDLC